MCMAGNWKTSGGIVNMGKRFFNQNRTRDPTHSPFLTLRRAEHTTVYGKNVEVPPVHVSVYDKNIEEQVCPAVVPNNAIDADSDEYWAPDPETGVFGPGTDNDTASNGLHASTDGEDDDSVLVQKAFFRPLEDLEKPQDS